MFPFQTLRMRNPGGAAVTDPDFASVVFLAGFNGADGATSFTEESQYAATGTFLGNAQLDTGITPPFGTASLLLDGTGDGVTFPDRSEYRLVPTANAPFTLDFQVYPLSTATPGTAQILFGQYGASGNRSWIIYFATNGQLALGWWNTSSTFGSQNLYAMTGFTVNAWNEMRFSYTGTSYHLYRNGSRVANVAQSIPAVLDSTAPLSVGCDSLGAQAFPGSLKEIRITRGVARSTGLSYTLENGFPRS